MDKITPEVTLKGILLLENKKKNVLNKDISCNFILNMSCDVEQYTITNAGIIKINLPNNLESYFKKFYKGTTKITNLEISF